MIIMWRVPATNTQPLSALMGHLRPFFPILFFMLSHILYLAHLGTCNAFSSALLFKHDLIDLLRLGFTGGGIEGLISVLTPCLVSHPGIAVQVSLSSCAQGSQYEQYSL